MLEPGSKLQRREGGRRWRRWVKTRRQRLSKADKPGGANRQQHGDTDPPPASRDPLLPGAEVWDFAPGANDIKANQQGHENCESGGDQDCLKDGLDLHQSKVFPPR